MKMRVVVENIHVDNVNLDYIVRLVEVIRLAR